MHRVDELYTAHLYYGSRRIAAQYRREGVEANRKAVQGHIQGGGHRGHRVGAEHQETGVRAWVYPYL